MHLHCVGILTSWNISIPREHFIGTSETLTVAVWSHLSIQVGKAMVGTHPLSLCVFLSRIKGHPGKEQNHMVNSLFQNFLKVLLFVLKLLKNFQWRNKFVWHRESFI